ncbi:sugar ABC transporter substrate-binding protein [Thalassospira profundimaris]|uniref:Probable sugar-binding periplasmic protein n=1 Tax=Thalassospira profundimaris TaxID=502049 RepID=A0A367WTX1_9PROT|nr:ABC transporter substrate-binding protein [Thalassospira profundimaris]RCK44915.1 sugar ABC transporter substrate-binding protein [Thalassospira profundimaris]
MSNKFVAKGLAAALAASVALVPLMAQAGDLVIESWRNDDIDIWNDKIIPAFNEKHPDIHVSFKPTTPTEYNAALNAKLSGGTAGDLIACRPFDASLELYKQGNLVSLNDLPGMDNFSDVAKSAWQTDDGSTTFCVPIASVIHGFIYNKEAFDEVGVEVPKTTEEFFQVLDKIKEDGTYIPMAMGTADQWEAATMGFQNIGPNHWKGEEGRKALIDGSAKFTDKPYVDTFKELARWKDYLPDGFEAISYPDAQNLFSLGRAAIYPAGSWDISLFNKQADFKFGAFPPPPPAGSDTCYISDHTDIGMGLNAHSKNAKDAKVFLEWMTGPDFAQLYSNALPGFFSLSNAKVKIEDPVAQEFVSWRQKCKSTIRNSYQILSRGTPNLENELWNVSAQVINGTLTPEQASEKVEDGLKKWYAPHQK